MIKMSRAEFKGIFAKFDGHNLDSFKIIQL